MLHITTIKHNDFAWHIIDKPTKKQINWLTANFKFTQQDICDCLPPIQRPKLVDREDYLFMILLFPYYDEETRRIMPSEVDFFISKNELVIIHNNELQPLKELIDECQKNKLARETFLSDGSKLLYELLNRLLHYCFPILTHVNQEIDNIEIDILKISEKRMGIISEILRIKRNIVNFRKIMQAHKSVMSKFISRSVRFFPPTYLHNYFNNLVNHTKDIWDFLENYKDTINALHETHESLLSHQLNEIIKTLTIFSVIVFPLTLLAAIFGMNAIGGMPFINSPHSFWLVLGIMLIGALGMLIYFKLRRWL